MFSNIFQNRPYLLDMKQQKRKNADPDAVAKIKRNIALQRKKKGYTQLELAHKMGVTQRVISYYENEAENLGLDAITTIAKALDVPVRKILDAEENDSLPEVPRALQRRIDKIKDLSPKAQKTVSDMIDALTKAEGTGK